MTLNNAHNTGYLDRGSARGFFKLNTVGENLVAMTLPGGEDGGTAKTKKQRKPKKAGRKRKTTRKAKKKVTKKTARRRR